VLRGRPQRGDPAKAGTPDDHRRRSPVPHGTPPRRGCPGRSRPSRWSPRSSRPPRRDTSRGRS
jgi:hypothetical protein